MTSNTTNTSQVPFYGKPEHWAQILAGGAEGAIGSGSSGSSNKREAREKKRRTLANLMNQALNRNQNLFRMGQEHGDEMSDFQSNALQQVAKGFVQALQGSTG